MPSRRLTSSSSVRSLGPLKPVGRLVQAQPLDRAAADLDDQLAGLEARLPRRSAPDHADQAKPSLSILSSTPRPTKLPSIMA